MHKRLFNEAMITLTISPDGPILIKAGESGVDPTRPDMEFVRTLHRGQETIYLPGSSLKGVLRAHCERIARTVDTDDAQRERGKPLSCDPLDSRRSCSSQLEGVSGPRAHERSCFICQLFGNTSLASHLRITDAYPVDFEKVRLEERNGVAIDRVTGAVAQGPFEMEILTEGTFCGAIAIRNFTLGQLGLLAAALLDIGDGLVPIGFGKSKGMGRVELAFRRFAVRTLKDPEGELRGVGFWADEKEWRDYGLPSRESERMPWTVPTTRVRGFYEAVLTEDAAIRELLEEVAGRWPEEVGR